MQMARAESSAVVKRGEKDRYGAHLQRAVAGLHYDGAGTVR